MTMLQLVGVCISDRQDCEEKEKEHRNELDLYFRLSQLLGKIILSCSFENTHS